MISDFSLGYGYLPVSWAFFTSFTFLLCYGIAVSQNHIYPFVPAISDTGARVPEANIFSEFFNFSIALMVVNLLIRYLQFGMLTHGIDSSDLLLGRLNKLGLAFGVVSAFGGTIIANFPSTEEDSMVYIHDVGAILLFGSGALYCWVQTSLTYKLTQLGMNSAFLFAVRFILTCVISVFGAIFFIAELFAYDEFRQQSAHAVVQWQPSDPGYGLHVLSNLSEWIAALCFGLFAITFFDEFQRISLNVECKQNREDASRSLVDYSAINEQDEEQH